MTFFEFNSKINLPEVCRLLGVKDLKFIKVPKFGWFAYNKNMSQILHLFQFFSDKDIFKIYKEYTVYNKDVQDFAIIYSENSENKLFRDYHLYRSWLNVFRDAESETERSKVYFHQQEFSTFNKLLDAYDMQSLKKLKIGLITEDLMQKHKWVKWPKDCKNKLLMPTYCTPLHPCSFEVVSLSTLQHYTNMYLPSEMGWYGDLNKCIVSDIAELAKVHGNTWDHKCDLWMTKPVQVSSTMPVMDCLRIWVEGQNTMFINSPLDVIKANKKEEEIKIYSNLLNLKQVKEVEQTLGIKLVSYWEKQRSTEIHIGNLIFEDTGTSYNIITSTAEGHKTEYTNFTISIDKIIKSADAFYRRGVIKYQDKEVPFLIEEVNFMSPKALRQAIHTFFFHHGLGVPNVLYSHRNYLLDVVNKFNPNIQIENYCPTS
jgi:hypothetical protein